GLFVRAWRPAKSHGWSKVILGPLDKSQCRPRKNGTEIFRPIQVIAPPIGFDDVRQTVVEGQARAHAPRVLNVTTNQVILPGLGFPVAPPTIGVPDPNRQRAVHGSCIMSAKVGTPAVVVRRVSGRTSYSAGFCCWTTAGLKRLKSPLAFRSQ